MSLTFLKKKKKNRKELFFDVSGESRDLGVCVCFSLKGEGESMAKKLQGYLGIFDGGRSFLSQLFCA